MRTHAVAIAQACEPLLGRHHGVMHHSAQHGGHVSLWIQSFLDGEIQVDAIVPMDGYRVLFERLFRDGAQARAFWQAQFLELFGFDPLE